MGNIYVARQPIKNLNGKVVAYELLYRDSPEGIKEFPSHMKATSHVLINSLTHIDITKLADKDTLLFINVDSSMIESDLLELLDPNRYVIEIIETTIITPDVLAKIKHLKKKGFKIVLDDFDGSAEMTKRFSSIIPYVDIVKVCIRTCNIDNIRAIAPKLKQRNISLLAEKVETKEDVNTFRELGFDLFQGWYFGKPEVITCESIKDATQMIILKLIGIIRSDGETTEIENFIKRRPELIYNILKFINKQHTVSHTVTSIGHAITLMGRSKLTKWLMIYLYSEVNGEDIPEVLLQTSIKRAEEMENLAVTPKDKDQAFMTGMFSMVGKLFHADTKEILTAIQADHTVTKAILEKSGELGKVLKGIEQEEKRKLKAILDDHYEKIEVSEIISLLDNNKIKVNL